MHRQRIAIDGGPSYLEKHEDGSARSVIIFIHGIFGSVQGTWGDTPAQIMTNPGLGAFDYGAFEYRSSWIDLRSPERFLWIRTHLTQYTEIFFIAHSMGGLIVRHAIVKMLGSPADREIAIRIRRCFLIASPIEGSWAAKTLRLIRPLRWLNSSIRYLAQPTIGGDDMSAAYKAAAGAYMREGGSWARVPTFRYFTGQEDVLVSKAQASFYTDFDKWEGPLPGSHSTVKLQLDANSTCVRNIVDSITEVRTEVAAAQESKIDLVKAVNDDRERAVLGVPPPVRKKTDVEGHDVILVSCSRQKSGDRGIEHPGREGIEQQLVNEETWPQIAETRSRILRLIHQGKIDGVEFKEGNRIARRENEQLILGPDFGGALNREVYLPAYARYTGRCFKNIGSDDWKAMLLAPERPVVLIMSGLYGLIPASEFIQNYDVHLTDVDTQAKTSLQSYWKDRDLMTQILVAHLQWIERELGPVRKVIDVLSELSYQETITWGMVNHRWPVLHRVFKHNAGSECLANVGFWLRDAIRDPGQIRDIEADRFYDNGRFLPKGDQIAFERTIGACGLPVAREIRKEEAQS